MEDTVYVLGVLVWLGFCWRYTNLWLLRRKLRGWLYQAPHISSLDRCKVHKDL